MGIDRIQWILHFTLEELRYSESTPICLKAEHEDVCRMKCLVVAAKRDITNISILSVVTTLHASQFMHPQFHVILSVMSMEGFMCLLSIVENSSPYDTIIA